MKLFVTEKCTAYIQQVLRVYLRNTFYFGSFHGIMNTSGLVESKGSPKYNFSFEIV